MRSSPFKLESRTLAGTALFGALAIILTTVSQALLLRFPLIPYLQFDLGEVAILLSMFILGPVPALISALVESAALMFVGQFVPIGPLLKLVAILSSLLGIWIGLRTATKIHSVTLSRLLGFGTAAGVVSRVLLMTVANYLLILVVFTVPGLMFLVAPFQLIGITLTVTNALFLVLLFTGVFNALQLAFVSAISALIIHSSQIRNSRVAGRAPWIIAIVSGSENRPGNNKPKPGAILSQ
jgi:riboflavin transporter FmnP